MSPILRTRVKLCGIRSDVDLQIAISAGADAVGLISGVTHLTEDSLSQDQACALASRVPPYVSTVLVTHLTDAGNILDLAASIGVDTIQIHGEVTLDTARSVFAGRSGRRVTKVVHVNGPEALDEAERFAGVCDAIHLDTRTEDRLGGTGLTHDWTISAEIAHRLSGRSLPCVLAGGLTAENVSHAISLVNPYAVDVNSGIENEMGNKDERKAHVFVESSRRSRGLNAQFSSDREKNEAAAAK